MSELTTREQRSILDLVLATERAIRASQQPDKINLASLGNLTPHVHWHVIPRWFDDSHFPGPIWATAQRVVGARAPADKIALRSALDAALRTG